MVTDMKHQCNPAGLDISLEKRLTRSERVISVMSGACRIKVLFAFLLLSAVLCAVLDTDSALGDLPFESKTVTLGFDSTALRSVRNGDRDFLILRQPRCVYPDDPVGAPVVPARLVRVVVPWNAKFQKITVTDCTSRKLAGKFDLDYVREECPPGAAAPASEPDKEIYGKDDAFPAKKAEFLRAGLLRGYKIFFFRVNPVQYLPKSKELLFHTGMTLKIEYSLDAEPDSRVRPRKKSEIFRAMLARSVENPADIDGLGGGAAALPWGGGPLAPGGPAHYLIITVDIGKDAFQPLADWKKQKGVPAKIVTVESIETDYTGTDTQEKIKNCIIDHVNNNETVYVLLGGDVDSVPHRPAYLQAYALTSNTCPCDLYYAGLDDVDWDDDNDGKHGELESDGDTIDLDPDVFVGRISCGSVADAQAYVTKVLEYEKEPPAANYGRELLLSGAMAWSMFEDKSDVHTWSQRMYNDCIAPYWSPDVTELFDTTPALPLDSTTLTSKINEGFGILNMSTHGLNNGWFVSVDVYLDGEASSQVNDKQYTLIYTIACDTNCFDSYCLGEAFTRNADGGAIAYIGCSRYGWGDQGSYLGGRSYMLNRTFYVKLLGENLYHLGEAYTAHKWEHVGECATYNPYRWIQLGINLLGDPELPVWTGDPQTMSAVYPQEIPTGSQTIHVKVEPGAHVCLWKDVAGTDEVYVYGDADDKGGYSAVIDPATTGTLKLTATKQNFYPYEADITVTDTPALYVATAVLPDGEAGAAYSAALAAGGGTQPYAWTVPVGNLPDGLALNGSVIEGAPTAVGSWTFTVQVEDSSFDTATAEFTVDVTLDVPDLQDFASPDYDGNYTAQWAGSDAPTHYELQEATSFTDQIADDAESGTGLWTVDGFAVSSARSHSATQSFYGGSGTDMDNTMTYNGAITVGGASQASFWCWYEMDDGLTEGHDFGYFEISLNGGSTWLRARTFGGSSGGWVQETVDLSAYAGQSILMRFRYFTSHDEFSEGLYVDDILVTNLAAAYDWTTLSSAIADKYHDIAGRGLGMYYYRVRAFDGATPSGWSEVKSVSVEEPVMDLLDGAAHTVGAMWVSAGETFSMGLDVSRSGSGVVPAHRTEFYFSTDDIITTSDYSIGEYTSPGFDAATETQSISVPFPGSVPEGTYYIGCIIDRDNDVGETDENNNTVLFAGQVSVIIKYTLTVNCSGSGSVTREPDQPAYDPGDPVTLTAVPDTDWLFDHWEDDLTGSVNPATVTMDDSMSITAVFIPTNCTLTINIIGSGTVTTSPSQATYNYGDMVTLTAVPDKGCKFDRWEGDLTGSENPVTITIDSDKTIEAYFAARIVFLPKDGGGGCSCSIEHSRGADSTPRAAAGCILPLLMTMFCLFLRRRRLRSTRTFLHQMGAEIVYEKNISSI